MAPTNRIEAMNAAYPMHVRAHGLLFGSAICLVMFGILVGQVRCPFLSPAPVWERSLIEPRLAGRQVLRHVPVGSALEEGLRGKLSSTVINGLMETDLSLLLEGIGFRHQHHGEFRCLLCQPCMHRSSDGRLLLDKDVSLIMTTLHFYFIDGVEDPSTWSPVSSSWPTRCECFAQLK